MGKFSLFTIVLNLDDFPFDVHSYNINSTLLFSKQNQKILLGNTLTVGVENALKGITEWRRRLIKIPFAGLMRNFGVL